ncbi:MAG TPA: carboxylesterase [Burkholderiales bacterium]|jgi:phospholipase/carboxylesterase|nr:carboxylesterase [Burkholderiales bacterium]
MQPATTQSLLPAVEIETRSRPSHAVIWLHGLGADGNDFVPVVDALPLPRIGIRFVFPHAPMMPVTINGGFVMRAWYDVLDADFSQQDERGIRASQRAVEALIARETERGIPASRIVLAGFSQGGVMTLHVGLRYPKKLAGLMALSAYLPLANTVEKERSAANRPAPIFMAHGNRDPIIPIEAGWSARDQLLGLGYAVQWHEYDMPHCVCPEEIQDIGRWLQKVLL